MKPPLPFVASVTNPRPSVGGADQETVDQVRQRAPSQIRSGTRAVTADDFETLAKQTPGAMIKRCTALPLYNPLAVPMRPAGAALGATTAPVPGVVTVVVIPASRETKPLPTTDTMRLVGNFLRARCPVATEVFVIAPNYREVLVDVSLIALPSYVGTSIAAAVMNKLLAFFHPLTGGVQGTGWPFGGPISVTEVYRQVLTTPGVDRIVAGKLTVFVDGKPVSDQSDVLLAANETVSSDKHLVDVRYN